MDMDEKAERYEQLTAYLDGELSNDERREVEALLDQDAEARKLLAQLRETSGLMTALPRARASSELTASIMGRLERRELLAELEPPRKSRPRVRSFEWVRPIGVAAGMAIVCTASWLVYKQTSGEARKAGSAGTTVTKEIGPAQVAPTQFAHRDKSDAAETFAKQPLKSEEQVARRESNGAAGAGERIAAAPTAASDSLGQQVVSASPAAANSTGGAPAEAGGRPTAPPAVKMGVAYDTKNGVAGRPPASGVSNRLADSLATNSINAGGVLKAGFEEFSNRLVLETDQYTTQEIMARVRSFMLLNEVPDLKTVPAEEALSGTQAFYAMNAAETEKDEAKEDEDEAPAEWTPVRVVANLPVDEAAKLVETMQRVTRRRPNSQWTANSTPLSGKESTDELAGLFLASADNGQFGETELRRQVQRDDRDTAAGGGASARAEVKGESKPADEPKLGKARRGAAESAAVTTAPATKPDSNQGRFVTVAILLTPPTAALPTESEAVGKSAPASAPTTSQSTKESRRNAEDERAAKRPSHDDHGSVKRTGHWWASPDTSNEDADDRRP